MKRVGCRCRLQGLLRLGSTQSGGAPTQQENGSGTQSDQSYDLKLLAHWERAPRQSVRRLVHKGR